MMDLETENRIAAILLKEAAELRREAEKEGVRAYLEKPNVRFRPNSRFLTATVLGVQQANKAVEVNEMWRLRNQELELNERLRGKPSEEHSNSASDTNIFNSTKSSSKRQSPINKIAPGSSSSSRLVSERFHPREDEGLGDEEIDEFLHSRFKRGRGSVGSRIDETGPYLHPSPDTMGNQSMDPDTREHRVILRPERPSSLRPASGSSSDEEFLGHVQKKEKKKGYSEGSKKKTHRKHKSKHKSKDKEKKKRKEKKRKCEDVR